MNPIQRALRPSPSLVRWFTPGLNIKRWLVLLFVAIMMLSLAAGYAVRDLYTNVQLCSPGTTNCWASDVTLQFLPRLVRGALFATLGIGLLLLAFYKLGQSLLGPYMPGRRRTRALIDDLYAFRLLAKGPRVVSLGGGTGLSTMLRGIKRYTGNVVAIVTVADDGGSSGRLREEYRVLPPGDFRQCLTALAETEPLMTQLFSHRFSGDGELGGHSFGNLFIMAMTEITGDFEHALRESGRVLATRGQIVPSTLTNVVLCANVGDEVRVGESNVPDGGGRIDHVFLEPAAPPINPEAEAAILDAELITVGPGSLYTSILPNLLVDGMVEALRASPAIKVYICNVASQPGETTGYSVSEHLETLEQHIGGNLFDYVIVNSNFTPPLPDSAQRSGITRVVFDRDKCSSRPIHFVLADVVSARVSSHHDPDKLARVIMKRVWR